MKCLLLYVNGYFKTVCYIIYVGLSHEKVLNFGTLANTFQIVPMPLMGYLKNETESNRTYRSKVNV